MTITPLATVGLRFDDYVTTYRNAYPVMKANGLVGTFAVGWDSIDPSAPSADNIASWMLRELERAGWDIAAYSNFGDDNMLTYLANNGSVKTLGLLFAQRAMVMLAGVRCDVLVPNQRAWNSTLAGLAGQAGFKWVNNVNDEANPQPQPIPNPLFFNQGGSASLSSTSTIAGIRSILDAAQAANSVAMIVIHKVVPDADVSLDPNYSIGMTLFCQIVAEIKTRRDSGLLRCCCTTSLNPPQWVGT